MDDELSKGNVEKSLVKSNSDVPTEFELGLFLDGTLEFNVSEVEEKANEIMQSKATSLSGSILTGEERGAELLKRHAELSEEALWAYYFSGLVPKHWDKPLIAQQDLKNARRGNVKLTSVLVDAGISHPNRYAAREAAKGQHLTVRQLSWIFARSDIVDEDKEEIVDIQMNNGLTAEEVEHAKTLSQEILEEAKRRNIEGNKTFLLGSSY